MPAPLGLLEDRRGLVLLEPASGRALTIADAQNPAAFEHGVRRAAAWLGVLHSAPVSAGPAESTAQAAYRLAGRAVKATALCPDLAAVFRQMLTELGRRHATTGEKRGDVQTHGRFHAGHVFLARDCVTGVDLDRAALTDPAKDVAEYLFGLRALAARRVLTDRAVDDLCDAFLDEYRGRTPGDLAGLTYHWSYVVAWALLGLAFKDRPGRRGWSDRVEFMRAEFDGAPGRVAAWLALA